MPSWMSLMLSKHLRTCWIAFGWLILMGHVALTKISAFVVVVRGGWAGLCPSERLCLRSSRIGRSATKSGGDRIFVGPSECGICGGGGRF